MKNVLGRAFGLAVLSILLLAGCQTPTETKEYIPGLTGSFSLTQSAVHRVTVAVTTNADSFAISRASSAAGPWTSLPDGTTTPFTDNSIVTAGTYYYKVTLTKGSATYDLAAQTMIVQDLVAPATVAVTAANTPAKASDSIVITWGSAALATKYDLYFSSYAPQPSDPLFFTTASNFSLVKADLDTTSYTITPPSFPAGYTSTAGSSYFFYVVAKSGTDASPKSQSTAKITYAGPAGAATGLVSSLETASGSNVVKLTWADDPNADGYIVFRSVSKTGPWGATNIATVPKKDVIDQATKVCTWSDATAQASTVYWYLVHGYSATSGPTNLAGVVTSASFTAAQANPVSSATTLARPTNVSASSDGSNVINLSWTAVSNATGYTVYRSVTQADGLSIGSSSVPSGLQTLTTTAGVTYADSNNIQSVTYYYWVVATGPGNAISLPSATASYSVKLAPQAPTAVKVTPLSPTSVSISWAASTGPVAATAYTVQHDETGTFLDDTNLVTVPMTSGIVVGLVANKQYNFRVIAYSATGAASQPSSTVSASTFPASPTLTKGAVAANSVVLNWTSSAGAALGYRVYQDNGVGYVKIADIAAGVTTYTATSLVAGTTYKFKVTAPTAAGEPDITNDTIVVPLSVTTTSVVAPTVNSVSFANSKVTVNWTAVMGATGYTIQYRINPSPTWVTVDNSASPTTIPFSFTPGAAGSGSIVYVQVKATTATGVSEYSTGNNYAIIP